MIDDKVKDVKCIIDFFITKHRTVDSNDKHLMAVNANRISMFLIGYLMA